KTGDGLNREAWAQAGRQGRGDRRLLRIAQTPPARRGRVGQLRHAQGANQRQGPGSQARTAVGAQQNLFDRTGAPGQAELQQAESAERAEGRARGREGGSGGGEQGVAVVTGSGQINADKTAPTLQANQPGRLAEGE